MIKEIGYCIFSVFFDANTISTTTANGSNESYDYLNDSFMQSKQATSTTLNCFSVIIPLDCKNILVDHYGDTKFMINSFENIILEFKVYAQIKSKINRTTSAIENLTHLIKKFCLNLNVLRQRGIHPISNYDLELKNPVRVHIKDTFLDECYFTTPSYSSICNDFLVNSISSHIISNFNTIVIGKTSASVNKVFNFKIIFFLLNNLITIFKDDQYVSVIYS